MVDTTQNYHFFYAAPNRDALKQSIYMFHVFSRAVVGAAAALVPLEVTVGRRPPQPAAYFLLAAARAARDPRPVAVVAAVLQNQALAAAVRCPLAAVALSNLAAAVGAKVTAAKTLLVVARHDKILQRSSRVTAAARRATSGGSRRAGLPGQPDPLFRKKTFRRRNQPKTI